MDAVKVGFERPESLGPQAALKPSYIYNVTSLSVQGQPLAQSTRTWLHHYTSMTLMRPLFCQSYKEADQLRTFDQSKISKTDRGYPVTRLRQTMTNHEKCITQFKSLNDQSGIFIE